MTRVLVIGSSHIGALTRSGPAFEAAFPDISVTFFGVRGPNFLSGKFDDNGHFVPGYGRDQDRDLAVRVNGTDTYDASGFDDILMIGQRLGFGNIVAMMYDQDVLEGSRSDRQQVLPRALMNAAIRSRVESEVAALTKATAARGGVTIVLAPYPASGMADLETPFARSTAAFWRHPEADAIFQTWTDAVTEATQKDGHRVLWQPPSTVAGPFQTKPEFAENVVDWVDGSLHRVDHRHMNAQFGLKVLEHYAREFADTPPIAAAAPAPIN